MTTNKLKMHSPDLTRANIDKLAELFPNCVAEAAGADGVLKRSIDFDQLRQEMSGSIVEGPQERYQLNWPGKREALLTANAPIAKTLRPCREESVDFDTTQNLFIEGDNLDALKLLQETYLNKVKLIYIDPPYNTGNDFIYEDDFAEDSDGYLERSNQKDLAGNRMVANTDSNGRFHSDWLTMIYPRLKLARNLLSEDGAIFISIDDNEQANLRRLCDEIFGEDNFIAHVVWQKKYAPQNDATYFSAMHDHILVYAKLAKSTKNDVQGWSLDLLPRTESQNAVYKNHDNDPRGLWRSDNLSVKTYSVKNDYPITTPNGRVVNPPESRCWVVSKVRYQELVADNRIWFGADGTNVPSLKRFLSEVKDGTVPVTWWTYQECGHNQDAKKELKDLFVGAEMGAIFDTPKPTKLLSRMLNLATKSDPNALVLDFFAGSGTTGQAVSEMNLADGGNRRYILVQLPETVANSTFTIADLTKERLRRAGKKVSAEATDISNASQPDVGFRVLKIDSSNMKEVYYTPDAVSQDLLSDQVNNIREDRTAEDLLFQVLLDWGVDLALPISKETIAGKTVYFVDADVNGKPALAACFDVGVGEEFVKLLAQRQPLRVVFRDAGFATDSVKINVEQIFKLMSPSTEVKCI
jgi:adenine-specific DNA-methyltransferase